MGMPKFGSSAVTARNVHSIDYADSDKRIADTATMWARYGDTYYPLESAEKKLAPGFYRCVYNHHRGPGLERMEINTDDLFELPDDTAKSIHKEFMDFWDRSDKFRESGIDYKRGILLWGPPGGGKTSLIYLFAKHMIEKLGGYVVVAGEPDATYGSLRALRMIEPDSPLIVLYEDLDSMVERYGEPSYLAMLDGEYQITNVMNIGTTNYPERLDARFVSRPGRFDRVEEIGMPSEMVRDHYLKAKFPELSDTDRTRLVKRSEGWSIAYLREYVVSVRIMGLDPDATFDRLMDMITVTANSEHVGKNKVGFDI